MDLLYAFLSKKITIKIPVWILALSFFVAYFGWELYWYRQVGLRFIKWHTHLMVYVYLWMSVMFVFQLVFKSNHSEKASRSFLIIHSILFSLFIMEICLMLTGTNKTSMEKVTGFYSSPFEPQEKTYYHVWNPAKSHWLTKSEFSYWRPTNSLGLGDIEWSTSNRPNQKRIMALGDSFTEGDGASNDSSYVALLRKKLLASGDSVYMMNAGVCGSDPFMNYILLKDKLLRYKPTLILQALGSNDLNTDIIVRGGMERFQKDGTLKYCVAPWWEPLFAVNYTSRIFFQQLLGYNELLRKKDMSPEDEKRITNQTIDLFHAYSAFCKNNNIRLLVILRPDKHEILKNKYAFDFSEILHQLKQEDRVDVIDLLPDYQAYIKNNHGMVADYFWKQDGHHNPKGYEMMAQTIFDKVYPLLKDSVVRQ